MEQDFQPHPVFYENPEQSHLNEFLDYHSRNGNSVYVLTDQNTRKHCLPLFLNKIGSLKQLSVIEIPAGEHNKNMQTCQTVWQELTEQYADRNAILINLGGGVLCDLGGFAATVYKRGIRFIHFPTSLLAMTDAAIGGKNGVDLGTLKNMIGAFSQPLAVFIDPEFMKTLPSREIKNGFAEMLKHGLISEESYFDELINNGPDNISGEQIRLSVEIKSAVVIRDPFEKNYRKVLNFGHTIGHALESYSLKNDSDPILHGEAVILGMICESLLSHKMQLLNYSATEKIIDSLRNYLPVHQIQDETIEEIIPLMQHDKKNKGITPGFTLLRNIGKPIIDHQVQANDIKGALLETALITRENRY